MPVGFLLGDFLLGFFGDTLRDSLGAPLADPIINVIGAAFGEIFGFGTGILF